METVQRMELIRGLHNLRPHHRGCVATIGAFDGVHRGHQAVINHTIERAHQLDLPSTVIVFEPLPREYFAPKEAPARLMSFSEKFVVLRDLSVDRLLRIQFNDSLSTMSADAFIKQIFVDGLGIQHIVAGDDLHFGRGREGDVDSLQKAGAKFGFTVSDTNTVAFDDDRVSSTRLRTVLEEGDFDEAERMLGRPYFMRGKVVYGRQVGATIGVPTANLELHRKRSPLSGVFAVEVRGVGDSLLPGVANVGTRPTIDDGLKANLEVHLLDFNQNLYGEKLEVLFRQKIREEKKFESLEELTENIHRDIETARQYFKDR